MTSHAGTVNPISDYGLIGDTRTAALCSSSGSIDWLCLPRFDSDPVFGRLLGGDGSFAIGPAQPADLVSRRYWPGSAVLETRWRTGASEITLTEGMVSELGHELLPSTLLVRRVQCDGAPAPIVARFDPRRGDGKREPNVRRRRSGLVGQWGALAVGLRVEPEHAIVAGRDTEITLSPGQPVTFVMTAVWGEPLVYVSAARAWRALLDDHRSWTAWVRGIGDCGPYPDAVIRSLITLRLLTYSPSGAPVAAPTTSLPEQIGGARNWDYRYAWVRDASLGISGFLGVGRDQEARAFMFWLLHASRLERPQLPPMFNLDGKRVPPERTLDWPGYADSRPVRVGNGARAQHQLDCYGWVVDAAARLSDAGQGLYGETWRTIAGFADLVAKRWREPDSGLWEERTRPAHFVHSKLMGWVALDRAFRLTARHRTRPRKRRRWLQERESLLADVLRNGYDRDRRALVRAYGRSDLDAALVRAPLLGVDDANAPVMHGTVDAIRRELGAGGALLYRYPPGTDGLTGGEGAFLPCSYWLAQALARMGRVDEAVEVLEQLAPFNNGLGLLPEEIDPMSRAYLGNFPQAFTHAAHVAAALEIRDAISEESGGQAGVA